MKNKHFLFSISLAISVAVIMLLSVFVDSTVFDGIAQTITIPFLLFTVASCAFSIVEEIISTSKTKCTIVNEIHERWNYYKNTLETQLGWVHKYDNPQNKCSESYHKILLFFPLFSVDNVYNFVYKSLFAENTHF